MQIKKCNKIFIAIFMCLVLFAVTLSEKGYAIGSFYELKRSDIAFQVGASIPLGAFGRPAFNSVNINDKTLAYDGAAIGVSYGLTFDFYVVNDYLGIFIGFQGHSNNVKSVDQVFTGLEPASALGRKKWDTKETDKWNEFMALAGITFRYPIVDWMLFTSRIGLGYAHLLSPFYRAYSTERNNEYTHDFSSNSESAFGFTAGVGLKFLLSRWLHLDIKADYMGASNFKYSDTKSVIYLENKAISDSRNEVLGTKAMYSFKESFHVVDVSLGFTVAF